MIYDLKRSVDQKMIVWSPVLHLSLDDLVLCRSCHTSYLSYFLHRPIYTVNCQFFALNLWKFTPGNSFFHRQRLWCLWQVWGMCLASCQTKPSWSFTKISENLFWTNLLNEYSMPWVHCACCLNVWCVCVSVGGEGGQLNSPLESLLATVKDIKQKTSQIRQN